MRYWTEAQPDTIAAILGVLLGIALLPLRLFTSQIFVQTIPIVTGVASGLYLLTKRYDYGDPTIDELRVSARTVHGLRMGVLVGLAGMVFVGTYTGGRTIPFFALGSIVGTLVFLQILLASRSALDPTAVLVQVVAFALVVRWMALATTPGLIGVDAWEHIHDYAHSIRESGQLSAIADTKYFGAPLYHLLVVTAAGAFQSSLRIGLYATLGLVMPLSVLLIYFTTDYFLPVRWALFAAATFGVADHFVRWGIHIIPTSMGVVLFMGVVYGVTRIYATGESLPMYGLVLFLAIATVLTHQISTAILLVFLGAGVVAQLWYSGRIGDVGIDHDDGHHVDFLKLFVIVLPITVLDWSLSPSTGTSFLEGMIGSAATRIADARVLDLASADVPVPEGVRSVMTTLPWPIALLDALGFLVVLLVFTIGAFTVLRRDQLGLLPATWIVAAGLMLIVTLGLPLLGLYFLIPGRWFAFAYVPMILLGAAGMRHLELTIPAKSALVVLVAVALLVPGPMLVDHKATHDNPVHDESYHQFAYSESELEAARTIAGIHPGGTELYTDKPYYFLLRDWQEMSTDPIRLTASGTASGEYVVYRQYQSEAGTQMTFDGEPVWVQLPMESVCGPSMDVIYTNGDVRYCSSPTGGGSQ